MPGLLATRELLSMAARALAFLAGRYTILGMKTTSEIRRDNLILLIAAHTTTAALNEKLGFVRTDATLSQIKNQSPDSKTGTPKAMGDKVARLIEQKLGLETGWMDNPQWPSDHRQQRITHAVQAMQQMGEWQLSQTLTIIDTIALPGPATKPSDPGS